MKLEPVPLFLSRRDVVGFIVIVTLILIASLGREYANFAQLTRFDDAEVAATVVSQYTKTKGDRHYEVLRLRMKNGASFYMTGPTTLRDLQGYEIRALIRTEGLTFLDYLRGFFARGYIEATAPGRTARYRLARRIEAMHGDRRIGAVFAALFATVPVGAELRERLGIFGVSHLLAISGFHVGLLSVSLFWLLAPFYRFFQSRCFPWRNIRRDLFMVVAVLMFGYVALLDAPPSMLRAYAMLLIGFVLHDRGVKLVSVASLAVAAALLAAIWPRLMFSIGFWLSVSGVFFVFSFLRLFRFRHKAARFFWLHWWVYAAMLPIGLRLFGLFSLWHVLSPLWTMAFVVFYPIEIVLHLAGAGDALDGLLRLWLAIPCTPSSVHMAGWTLVPLGVLGMLQLKVQPVKWLFLAYAAAVFVGAVYQVA